MFAIVWYWVKAEWYSYDVKDGFSNTLAPTYKPHFLFRVSNTLSIYLVFIDHLFNLCQVSSLNFLKNEDCTCGTLHGCNMYENTNLKYLNHLNNSVGGLAKKPHLSSCRRLACCSVLSNNLTNSLENFLYPSSCLHFQSYNFPKFSCPKPKMVLLLYIDNVVNMCHLIYYITLHFYNFKVCLAIFLAWKWHCVSFLFR